MKSRQLTLKLYVSIYMFVSKAKYLKQMHHFDLLLGLKVVENLN